MNSRNDGRGFTRRSSELRVEEVILPLNSDKRNAGLSEHIRKSSEDYGCRQNTRSSKKLGEHETTAVCGLIVLEKLPVEDYVQGTRKKTYRKKKLKPKLCHPKDEFSFCNSFLQVNEIFQSENQVERNLASKTLEERFLEKNLERKIQCYESEMKLEEHMNCRRQRHLEKESMKELENLSKTWLGMIQKRGKIKETNQRNDILSVSKSSDNLHHHNPAVDISLMSKKYWNDEADQKMPKRAVKAGEIRRKETHQPSALDKLEDDFFEKLVFVDDDDLG